MIEVYGGHNKPIENLRFVSCYDIIKNACFAPFTNNRLWILKKNTKQNEEVMCFGCLEINYLNNKDWCYLGPAQVNEEFRGKGLQKELIKERLRIAIDMGLKVAFSATYQNNIISANNLIKCGFFLDCTNPEIQNFPNCDYFWFRKDLV